MKPRFLWPVAAIFTMVSVTHCALQAADKESRQTHVELAATGISKPYTDAIARTVESARGVAVEQFGFNMPQTVYVSVVASPNSPTRLFNDGEDHINLTVPSEQKLQRPAVTGTFHLYGFCHEIGHLAMYRAIPSRNWLSSAGAEGWAHYAGCRILDAVYAREGEKLWPDAYNYLEDGTARLREHLADPKPDPTTQAAGLWLALGQIVGDQGFAPLFAAWGKLQPDETKPEAQLKAALLAAGDKDRLEAWWKQAAPVLLVSAAKSSFAAETRSVAKFKVPPKELAQDDGGSAGKSSMAGSGHAVRFEGDGELYLTAVRIYGSRYGYPAAPRENAFIWLCDSEFKHIATFPFAYGTFVRGEAKWVTIPVKPTRVPSKFMICVGFNPTATKGVFVHYDGAGSGNSFMGLPGRSSEPFSKGDWLIRAVVQEPAE